MLLAPGKKPLFDILS